MKCYISKITKVTYGKYPYTLIVNFEGEKGEMEFMKKEIREKIKQIVEKSIYQLDKKIDEGKNE